MNSSFVVWSMTQLNHMIAVSGVWMKLCQVEMVVPYIDELT